MSIRKAKDSDFEQIWPFFEAIVSKGDSYGFAADTNKQQAFELWMKTPQETFVYEADNQILGSYYLKPNFLGPGEHVCNCGYMVLESARGKGIATKLCIHSQELAFSLGFRGMQFNYVSSSNQTAIKLWEKLGFETIGLLPEAFKHPVFGFIDAHVMYKKLES